MARKLTLRAVPEGKKRKVRREFHSLEKWDLQVEKCPLLTLNLASDSLGFGPGPNHPANQISDSPKGCALT